MSALSPPPPARGGAGHDSTLRQCIALGNVGTCMETAEISAYVHKFQSYTDVYKEMRVKQVIVAREEPSGNCKSGRKCILGSENMQPKWGSRALLFKKSQCLDTGSESCRGPVSQAASRAPWTSTASDVGERGGGDEAHGHRARQVVVLTAPLVSQVKCVLLLPLVGVAEQDHLTQEGVHDHVLVVDLLPE